MSDDLVEEIEEQKADDESRSEAIRRFVRSGMTRDRSPRGDVPPAVDDATPDDAETTSFRQDSSRAERWLGSAVTLWVAGFVASEAFAAPVLSDVAFLGGVAAVTYFMTTTVVRRLQAARASGASDRDDTPAAEPAAGGE